jgi:hypothetical protein
VTKQADLIAYLFEGQLQQQTAAKLLSGELFQWMESSTRFTAFVETYRDKIRKKLRGTRDPESMLDVRGELEVAYGLLNDRRLDVVYEPYASAKRRGPDFSVTYRSNLGFNIEVARIRTTDRFTGSSDGERVPNVIHGDNLTLDRERKQERIVRILMDKLGQMQPGMPNLLVIHTQHQLTGLIDLDNLMQTVKTRAEGKDPSFYASSRYTSTADFFKDFHRLSAILLWASEPVLLENQLWVNKQARPGLPDKVLRLVRSLSSGTAQTPIDG